VTVSSDICGADGVARLYLEGKKLGQPATREQKEMIQRILAADYEGRTVAELLQNARDAMTPAGTTAWWRSGWPVTRVSTGFCTLPTAGSR
jgi:hypothetical protein